MNSGNQITQSLLTRGAAWVPDMTGVDFEPLKPGQDKPWRRWIEADLGFRNHWYPILPSRSLADGGHKALTLLGEEILFIRKRGQVHAVEDRCAHRGARFSCRPLMYTDDTITCFHHAFTYNLDDGSISCILNDPTSSMAGQKGIKIYPVEEAKGLIFCFVGDMNPPPPLAYDVPPGFLDPDMAVRVAEPYVVHSSWRLGCEGGYDPSHHFIHNWSPFNINLQIPAAFGFAPEPQKVVDTTTYVADQNGPKGFTRDQEVAHPRFRATIPANKRRGDVEVVLPLAYDMPEEQIRKMGELNYTTKVGLWMPCGLKVDPWPYAGLFHNEYYVPRDARSHYYIQCGWRRVKSEEERDLWENGELGRVRWEVPVVEDFTTADAFAREGTAKFYDDEGGWEHERLNQPDIELVMWRIFASENCRGVQKPDHAKGWFRR